MAQSLRSFLEQGEFGRNRLAIKWQLSKVPYENVALLGVGSGFESRPTHCSRVSVRRTYSLSKSRSEFFGRSN